MTSLDLQKHTPQVTVYANQEEASIAVAQRIAILIREKETKGEQAVLGLATGGTPKYVYHELIRLYQEEGLSFKNVITFNLDEYYPMSPTDEQSYVHFMNQALFNHIDIDQNNIFIPDGTLERKDIDAYCQEYEQKIAAMGGIDLQLLGIGRTGHIGFNEPGSTPDSNTRLVTLNEVTRNDASTSFGGIENVPTEAITMGVGTVLKVKEIILMAWTASKSDIIKKAIEGEISSVVPATFLQLAENVTFILDTDAASQLTAKNA